MIGGVRLPTLIGVVCLLAACAAPPVATVPSASDGGAAVDDCTALLARHDDEVRAAGVADAGTARIPGHPHLRVDRFLASFAEAMQGDPALRASWLKEARALDRSARAFELANLPRPGAGQDAQPAVARQADAVEACAQRLLAQDSADRAPPPPAALAAVPDDYSTVRRAAGLYPLVALPFSFGVRGWERETSSAFARLPPRADLLLRPSDAAPVARGEIARWLRQSERDGLGRADLSDRQRALLLHAYAPVWSLQVDGSADEAGAIVLDAPGRPRVDRGRPLVYAMLAWTRIGERVLPQAVYQVWFDERPLRGQLDVLGGRLDSVIWRITVDDDGTPLLADTIHGCGCYHMFLPSGRLAPTPAPAPLVEWVFVPAPLPAWRDGARLVVHLEATTHYVVGVGIAGADSRAEGAAVPGSAGTASPVSAMAIAAQQPAVTRPRVLRYPIEALDALRSLPLPAGGRRSLYGPDGIAPGTERAERLFFWPMGIDSAGAMRQWGRHATAFVGRRHFDDPWLIDRRFSYRAER